MIVNNFNLEILKNYECFYLLKNITSNDSFEVFYNTPSGLIEFTLLDAFSMPNGKILLAFKTPMLLTQYYNFIVRSDEVSEVIQTSTIERVIRIYDRKSTGTEGIFSFADSHVILEPNIDWRCDSGKFGPKAFESNLRIVQNLSDIIIYEPILSVNGYGHIVFLQTKTNGYLADENLNNAEKPVIGRSLWECLKIIREWSIVNEQPFNNNENISKKANEFMSQLKFSEDELLSIDSQVPMQIAKYIMGDENARQRPSDIFEINSDIKNILFRRLLSGTVSALEYLNPGMWNIEELISAELDNLENKKKMFASMEKTGSLTKAAVDMQNLIFNSKTQILNLISNGEF